MITGIRGDALAAGVYQIKLPPCLCILLLSILYGCT